MQNKEKNYKKMLVTVNGEPVGNGLLIDKVTYAPILNGSCSERETHNITEKTDN